MNHLISRPITSRLYFPDWNKSYCNDMIAINKDEKVMEYFESVLSEDETTQWIAKQKRNIASYGYGFFPAVLKESDVCIGTIGLQKVPYDSSFTPAYEIGWRLARNQWRKGYATEGARAMINLAENAGINEVVAITPCANIASEGVMLKIGMEKKGTFMHPSIAESSPLKECLLYGYKIL